jgi:hypothetical protein
MGIYMLIMYIHKFLKIVFMLMALAIMAVSVFADSSDINGPAPGNGPYMVFAHYMPSFPAYGYSENNNYWYNGQFSPSSANEGGLTARPILHPANTDDPEVSSMIWDIKIAKEYGIDGFLVDELWDSDTGEALNYRKRWTNLLKAAEIVGDFKIGLMPDYATLKPPTLRPESRAQIKTWLDLGLKSPALLRYDGKPVVFPYGVAYPDGRYKDKDNLLVCEAEKHDIVDWFAAQGTPISYALTIGINHPTYNVPYAKDPVYGFQNYAFAVGSFTPMASEDYFQKVLNYWPPSLMQMGENTFLCYARSWLYKTGDMDLSEKYRFRWKWNIDHRDRYRWVMLVTWNDWGETALAPSVNHFMTLQPLTRYYADWFKTGKEPTINHEVIEIFHRPHPLASIPTESTFRVQDVPHFRLTPPNDVVQALAFLQAPATLVIKTGDDTYRENVPAGVQSFIKPFSKGVQSAYIERNGKIIKSVTSPVPITNSPGRQNLWYIGADSDHPPYSIPSKIWTNISGNWTGNDNKRSGTGLSVFGDPLSISDAAFQADISFSNTNIPTNAGIVLHVNETGDSYIRLTINNNKFPTWQLEKVIKGVTSLLASGELTDNIHHQIRLDIVGEYHIAYIDDKLVAQVSGWIDWKDKNLRSYGKAGVYSVGGATNFSDINLESYDPAIPTSPQI